MPKKHAGKTTQQRCPGHRGIAVNEAAGACTKLATAITGGVPLLHSFDAASAAIRRPLIDMQISRC